jgi:hypothetical protein
LIVVFICDPVDGYPEFDFQTWYFMAYADWLKLAARVGEWAWVGRVL